jgi:hypothetical protein
LLRAVGVIERNYLIIPPDDPRFPALAPLTLVRILADGSTTPPVPDGQAFVTIQEKAVFMVGIWRRGDYGGHKESPINEAQPMTAAHDFVMAHAPQLLQEVDSTSLICPPDITERMVWPEDHGPQD